MCVHNIFSEYHAIETLYFSVFSGLRCPTLKYPICVRFIINDPSHEIKKFGDKGVHKCLFVVMFGLMDNLHNRPTLNPGKQSEIFHYSQKEHHKISRIAKPGGGMLQNAKNCIALRSLPILYTFVLREKVTIFQWRSSVSQNRLLQLILG